MQEYGAGVVIGTGAEEKVQECVTFKDWRGGQPNLHHISQAGLLLGWVDSESCNEGEQEQ